MILPVILSLVVALPFQGSDKLTSVRAYVFTDTTARGTPSVDEQGRVEAVRELKAELSKKKGISLVDRREDANLFVEVTGRELHDESEGPFGGKKITSLGDSIIRFRISSGGEESELKGMGQGASSHAAKDAADRIVKWIARREPPHK